jgi:hypothetical protein
MSSWTTQNLALAESQSVANDAEGNGSVVSKVFLNRDPEYFVVEIHTDKAGTITIEDSADGKNFYEVATIAGTHFDGIDDDAEEDPPSPADILLARFSLADTPVRNTCRIKYNPAGASTVATVSKVYVTWSP